MYRFDVIIYLFPGMELAGENLRLFCKTSAKRMIVILLECLAPYL